MTVYRVRRKVPRFGWKVGEYRSLDRAVHLRLIRGGFLMLARDQKGALKLCPDYVSDVTLLTCGKPDCENTFEKKGRAKFCVDHRIKSKGKRKKKDKVKLKPPISADVILKEGAFE